jgi:hypothetical protein
MRIRSYKSKGSKPIEHNNKALRRKILLHMKRQVSQMELFYLYPEDVDV